MSDLQAQHIIGYLTSGATIAWLLWLAHQSRHDLSWVWLELTHRFPVIGRIARSSSDPKRWGKDERWFVAERALCAAYLQHMPTIRTAQFMNAATYLRKAGDAGRRPLPALWGLLMLGFMAAEAWGFGYLLADYFAVDPSENVRRRVAWVIGFALAAVLMYITHRAGHEALVAQRIRTARQQWTARNHKDEPLQTQIVSLELDQRLDDDQPIHVQTCNRIGTEASWRARAAMLVLVAAVAVGGWVIRAERFEVSRAEAALLNPASANLNMASLNGSMLGGWDHERIEHSVGFTLMALLFVALQAMSVSLGYRFGFASREGETAWRSMGSGRYADLHALRKHEQFVMSVTHHRLESLQQALQRKASMVGIKGAVNCCMSVQDYMQSHETLTTPPSQTRGRPDRRERGDAPREDHGRRAQGYRQSTGRRYTRHTEHTGRTGSAT